jgi:hypothetical protein
MCVLLAFSFSGHLQYKQINFTNVGLHLRQRAAPVKTNRVTELLVEWETETVQIILHNASWNESMVI